MLSKEERIKLFQQKEQSTGEKVLSTVNKPMQWINEKIDKPWASLVTAPFSPETQSTEGKNWFEKERAEYEAWNAPKGVKTIAEMSNPVWWIPVGGIAGGVAKTAVKLGLPAAEAAVKTARGVQAAEKIVNLPATLATKGISKAVKSVIPDNGSILRAMSRFKKKTNNETLDGIDDAFRTQRFITELGKNKASVSIAKLANSIGSNTDSLQDDVIKIFGLIPSNDMAYKSIGKQGNTIASKVITNGSKVFNDIMENPSKAQLTPVQKQAMDNIFNFSDDLINTMKDEGIDITDLMVKSNNGRYFPRIVLGKVKDGKFYKASQVSASLPGSRTTMEKERAYATALKGIREGVVYADPVTTLSEVQREAYNRIANNRSGQILKRFTVTTGSRVNKEIRSAYATALKNSKNSVKAESIINRALRGEDVPIVTLKTLSKVSGSIFDDVNRAMSISVPQVDDVIKNLSTELGGVLNISTKDILGVLNKSTADMITPKELDNALTILSSDKNISVSMIKKIYNNAFNFTSNEKKDILKTALVKIKAIKATNASVKSTAEAKYITAKALANTKGITEGRVLNVPALNNRIFIDTPTMTGKEIADVVKNKLFPVGAGKEIESLNQVNSVARTLIASLDNSGAIIQGFPALGYDVSKWMRGEKSFIWGKLLGDSLQSLVKPSSLDNLLVKNSSFLEKHPTLITSANEYYAGVGGIESLLSKAPKVGKLLERGAKETYGRTGTAFTAAGLSGRISLAQSIETSMIKKLGRTELTAKEISDIDNIANILSGSFSSKLAGVGVKQSALESAVLFAPNYLRANLSVLREMLRGTATAREAQKAISGMLWGTFVGYHQVTKAIGAPQYLNPAPSSLGGDGGKFLTIKIGETNYGLPGFWYSLMRTSASIAAAAKENPEALISTNWRENPELNFLMSRASPMVHLASEIIEGKDFSGNTLDVRNPEDWASVAGEKVLPIMAQNLIIEKNGEWQSIFGSFMGLRTFPVSDADRRDQLRNDYAQIEYNMTWDELPSGRKDDIERKYEDLSELTDGIKQTMALQKGNDFQKAEYVVKQSITNSFNDNMNTLADSWLSGNISFNQYNEQRSTYLTQYFSEKDTVQQMKLILDKKSTDAIERYFNGKTNPLDNSLNEYRTILNTPLTDENGVIDWESTMDKADKYLKNASPETRDYINEHYRDWIKELPAQAQQVELLRDSMKELLVPYWNVRSIILNKNPRLKEAYSDYLKIKRTDPVRAQMILKNNRVLADAISNMENQVSTIRQKMRKSNPDLDKAVIVWYS